MKKLTQPIYALGSRIQKNVECRMLYPLAIFRHLVILMFLVFIAEFVFGKMY